MKLQLKKSLRGAFEDIRLDIDLQFEKPQIIGISGESGLGKTSILRCIAGLMNPEQGLIEFDGEVWFKSGERINLHPRQRSVSMVFQDIALYPHFSVRQNIAFGMRAADDARVQKYMADFAIAGLAEIRPSQLSGGQKQRVALARSLAADSKIVLLDEPLSALDSESRTEMQSILLKQLKSSKRMCFIVSHDENELNSICDRIFKLKQGELIEKAVLRASHLSLSLKIIQVEKSALSWDLKLDHQGTEIEYQLPFDSEIIPEIGNFISLDFINSNKPAH